MKFSKASAFILALIASQCLFIAAAIDMRFDWSKSASSINSETGTDVAVDQDLNVIWGFGQVSTNNYPEYSMRKLSPSGTLIWSKDFSMQNLNVYSDLLYGRVSTDANGNAAVVFAGVNRFLGSFTDKNYFWAGSFGRVTSTGTAITNGFETGTFAWGNSTEPFRAASATDASGNSIFAVPFTYLQYAGQAWEGNADGEGGILKVSASGSLIWFRKIIGPGNDMPTGTVVDAQGNVYVSGFFNGQAAFEATVLSSNGGRDGFIAKYDKNGDLLSVVHPFCTNDDSVLDLAIGTDGSIWFVGNYRGTFSFGATINSSAGNAYIGHMDANGNPLSIANIGSATNVSRFVLNSSGRMIVSGKFIGAPFGFEAPVPNRGSDDVYVAEITGGGSAQWAKGLGYIYSDSPGGIAISKAGEVYVAANVNAGVVLDSQFISGKSSEDVILAKLVDASSSQLPVFATQPISTASYFGGQAGLSVTVTSPVPVSYQWFKDGVAISGQTGATLSFGSVRPLDDGSYYVEVTNQYGTVRSDSVHLIVRGEAPVVVTTLAGTNVAGFVDSANPALVRFGGPDSPAVQSDGTVVIADGGNHAVRLLDPSGSVGTLAGKGTAGLSNGPASAAYFNVPIAIAISPAWDIFVADGFNNVVRKIGPLGVRTVSTYAGTGEAGFQNGPALEAKFNFPNDLVCAPDGTLFVTEFLGRRVRKISIDGTVSTVAGTGEAGYRDGAGGQAMFDEPSGLARDAAGNLYVAEWKNHTIRKITPAGVVSTIAGTARQSGFVDGPALSAARLSSPNGIAADGKGNIFFTEYGNSSVRRLDPLGDVLTLVGTAGPGFRDGSRTTAQMLQPGGVAVYPDGSLVVADTYNYAMRRVVWQTNSTPTEAAVLIELNPSITIFGIPGKTYRVEVSESLVSTAWVVLGEVTLSSAVETWYDSQPVTRGQRYYRAVSKE